MIKRTLLLTFVFLLFIFINCNPDCITNPGAIGIDSDYKTPGSQILISAESPGFLKTSKVIMDSGTGSMIEMQRSFEDGLGLIVDIPPETQIGDFDLYIEDPDCGGRIALSKLNVKPDEYFLNNPNFVTPAPPLIVIPRVLVPPPVDIVNAWFSPNNQEYCIWFQPDSIITDIDTTVMPFDTTKIESIQLVKGNPATFPSPTSSLELSAGSAGVVGDCNGLVDDDLFHGNPVSGIIDKEKNIIQIQIDRTSKSLGIEEFEGQFINAQDIPQYVMGSPCGANDTLQTTFMILTSKKTGRQLLLFRHPVF